MNRNTYTARWVAKGTKIIVRKIGTANPRWHTTTKPLDVPATAELREDGTKLAFRSGDWEVTVYAADVMHSRTRRLKAEGLCLRCGGRGRLPAFSHVQGGVCFKCGGSGIPNCPPALAGV